jgi:hypothetical protein
MTNMMKNMDSSLLAQMMKQQTGQDISQEQIESMKSMINPEMIEQMKNIDPSILSQMKMPTSTNS